MKKGTRHFAEGVRKTHLPLTAESLGQQYANTGQIDVRAFGTEDLHRVAENFSEFASFIDQEVATQLFEELMQQGAMSPDIALQALPLFSPEQRAQIGEYIFALLDVEQYAAVFQDCWDAFSEERQLFFRDEFVLTQPHLAYIVAPMIRITPLQAPAGLAAYQEDMQRYDALKNEPNSNVSPPDLKRYDIDENHPFFSDKISQKENIFRTHYVNNGSAANNLIESCIGYLERHPGCSTVSMMPHLREIYGTDHLEFLLLPHLDTLFSRNILPEESKGKKMGVNDYLSTCNMRCHITTEEAQYIQSFSDASFDDPRNIPEYDSLSAEGKQVLLQIQADVQERVTRQITRNYRSNEQYFSENCVEFITDLSENSYLPMLALDHIEPTAEELITLYQSSYTQRLFIKKPAKELDAFFGYIKTFEPDEVAQVEEAFVDNFVRALDGDILYSQQARAFFQNIDVCLEGLSPEGQERVRAACAKKRTEYCTVAPAEASVYFGATPAEIVEATVQNMEYVVYEYPDSFQKFRAAISDDIFSDALPRMAEAAFAAAQQIPNMVRFHRDAMEEIVGKEQYRFLVEYHIEHTHPNDDSDVAFVRFLLKEEFADFRPQCEAYLRAHPEFAGDVVGSISDFSAIRNFFGIDMAIQMFCSALEAADTPAMYSIFAPEQRFYSSRDDIIYDIARNPHLQEPFIRSLQKNGSLNIAIGVLNQCEYLIQRVHTYYRNSEGIPPHQRAAEVSNSDIIDGPNNISLKDVSQSIYESIQGFSAQCTEAAYAILDENPFAVYQCESAPQTGIELRKYVNQTIISEAAKNPTVVQQFGYLAEVGTQAYLRQKYRAFLAFQPTGKYGSGILSYAERERINPLGIHRDNIRRTAGSPAFYKKAMRYFDPLALQKSYSPFAADVPMYSPFARMYESSIKKIIRNESKRYAKEPDDTYVPRRFFQLMRRVGICTHTPYIADQADALLALPDEQKFQLVPLLEVMSYTGVIDQMEDMSLGVHGYDAVMRRARSVIERYIASVFGMDREGFSAEHLEIDTMEAVLQYSQSVKKKEDMLPALKKNIPHVLDDNFLRWRMYGEEHAAGNSTHLHEALLKLQSEKLIPRECSAEQYAAWARTDTKEVSTVVDVSVENIVDSTRSIIQHAVRDGHLDPGAIDIPYGDLQKEYEMLLAPQRALSAELIELQKTPGKKTDIEQQQIRALSRDIGQYKREHTDAFKRTQAQLYMYRIQHLTQEELRRSAVLVAGEFVPWKKAQYTIEKYYVEQNGESQPHIQRVFELLQKESTALFSDTAPSHRRFTITDEVNVGTYMRIGEEPVASCQSFAEGSHNNGLLATVVDPNTKVIQILDEDGGLVARSIMRLLEDRQGSPQIFIEEIYSSISDPFIQKAIEQFAVEKANALGVQAYVYDSESLEHAPDVVLKNTGSRTPWVYSDAGSESPNGQFSLSYLKRLKRHPEKSVQEAA